MSIRVLMEIFCDGCGSARGVNADTKQGIKEGMLGLELLVKDKGWIVIPRGRNPQAHFCPECLDKPVPEIPRQKHLIWKDSAPKEALANHGR